MESPARGEYGMEASFMTRSLCALFALAAVIPGCRDHDRSAATFATGSAAIQRPDQMVGGNVVPGGHVVPPGRVAEVRRLFESGTMSYPIAVVSAQGTQTQFVSPKPVFVGENRF